MNNINLDYRSPSCTEVSGIAATGRNIVARHAHDAGTNRTTPANSLKTQSWSRSIWARHYLRAARSGMRVARTDTFPAQQRTEPNDSVEISLSQRGSGNQILVRLRHR